MVFVLNLHILVGNSMFDTLFLLYGSSLYSVFCAFGVCIYVFCHLSELNQQNAFINSTCILSTCCVLVPEENIYEFGKRKAMKILQVLCFQENVYLNEESKNDTCDY